MPVPGLYGRKPPKRAPALQLARYLTGAVPAHPAFADYLSRLSGWRMLGNDWTGIVSPLLEQHPQAGHRGAEHGELPPLAEVLAFYETQNPGYPPDDGMDIQTALEDLVKAGGPDGVKAVGFAKVDYTDPAEVQAAIAIFGSIWTGINVQDAQQTQFNAGQPWDYVAGSPVDGGHSVIVGGYGQPRPGPLGGDEDFITWSRRRASRMPSGLSAYHLT